MTLIRQWIALADVHRRALARNLVNGRLGEGAEPPNRKGK